MFLDTHAHLFLEQFGGEWKAAVDRAEAAGVAAVFDVGLDLETNEKVMCEADADPRVFAIIGFHPHEAKTYDHSRFKEHLASNEGRYIGLGEFGLDYFHNFSPREQQLKAFEQQLELGLSTGLPLIFHCRDSAEDMLGVMRSAGSQIKGVMHCFSGDLEFLHEVLDLGMHISVGGPVTFPRSEVLRQVVGIVPEDRLLLETDCPYLAPQAFRGKLNEPAYIPLIASRIAEVRGVSVDEVASLTTRNAAKLFGPKVASFLNARGWRHDDQTASE